MTFYPSNGVKCSDTAQNDIQHCLKPPEYKHLVEIVVDKVFGSNLAVKGYFEGRKPVFSKMFSDRAKNCFLRVLTALESKIAIKFSLATDDVLP